MKHGTALASRLAFRAPVLGVVFLVSALLSGGALHAQAAKQIWEEYGKRIEASGKVDALGPNLFGDQVSLSNGALSFSVTDVSLPGNNALPVSFTRTFTVRGRIGSYVNADFPLADWEIDLPNISGVFAPDWISGAAATPYQRCSVTTVGAGRPPAARVGDKWFQPSEFWQGHQLSLPGGGGEMLLLAAGAPRPSTGGPYYWGTSDQTRVACLPAIKNWVGGGEGFLVITPDGTKYWFDWMAQYLEPAIEHTVVIGDPGASTTLSYSHPRRKNVLYPTRVEDRFGNWVTYSYANARTTRVVLTQIASSDGRQIDIGYEGLGRIGTVTAAGRTWRYGYGAAGTADYTLTSVTQPDGSQWGINLSGLLNAKVEYMKGPHGEPWRSCTRHPELIQPTSFTGTIKHPSGATGQFLVEVQQHGRTNVPVNCDHFTTPYNDATDDLTFWPISYHSLSLKEKTISGPGLPTQSWTYKYSSPISYYYPSGSSTYPVCPVGMDCSLPRCTSDECAGHSTTTVTDPAGHWVRHVYGNSYRYNEGKLLRVETGTGASPALRVASNTYDLSQSDGTYLAKWGASPRMRGEGFTSEYHRPQVASSVLQDGATFASNFTQLDQFANPVTVTRSSNLPSGPTRTEVTSYHHDYARWVIGQVASVTKTAPGTTQVVSAANYHASYALPTAFYSFGKLIQSLAYNADGTVATVKDGKSNTTTLSSWYRGIPRTISYPDATTHSAVVDANGWITRITDQNGYATNYGYDAMGRLASIVWPTGGTPAWNTTTQVFEPVYAAEYGIPSGHWRQTIATGNARKVSYFDARWRPLVTREYDATDVAGTQRFTRQAFDHDGRVTFASYPSAVDSPTTGTRTTYDALGRPTVATQDSEIGALTTRTEYLSGFQTRVTNPRGKQTVTSYMAFDQPTTDWPVAISHPEGAYTDITRDVFGKPTAITRRNAGGTLGLTRYYVYDGYQQLCKTLEPETGATLMDYDGAGNVLWSAGGLSLPALSCDRGSVAAGARVTRSYDARNRLTGLGFPDGNGSQAWSYWPDGLPREITTYNDEGLTTAINAYSYNNRRMLTGESLSQPGLYTWAVGYGYDANGGLANHTYPNGRIVDYAPNALGQPTRAGTYATGVSYFPNGAMKQFTYGNGIVHTLTQNARGLPDRSRDAYGAQVVHDDGLDYDANGNVVAITDGAQAGRGNRDMSYDGLDRLTAAVSPVFGPAAYTYDVLDNLRTVRVAGRDHTYGYDANWHLTNVMTTVGGGTVIGLGYDARGNLANRNGVIHRFDLGNRLRHVVGAEAYRYDAHGRRVEAANAAGSIFSFYGNDGVLRYQEDYRKRQTTQYVHLNGSLVAEVVDAAIVPPAPALSAPPGSSNGAYTVSWTSVAGARSYRLEESANGGAWTEVTEQTGLGWTASRGDGSYRYRVRSCALGCSNYSAIATVTVALIPQGTPTVSAPDYVTSGSYTVSWTGVSLATSYEVHEQANGGSWVQIHHAAGGSKAISGKAAGTYAYRARGCNANGCAGWSATAAVSVELPPAVAPGLTVPANGLSGAYTVSWGTVTGATSYTLEESANGGGWLQPYSGPATSRPYTGRAAGSYAYRVKACNPAGCSAASASKAVTVLYPPAAAPALTVPSSNTTGSYTVSWTAVGTAATYQLQERVAGGSWAQIHDAAGTSSAISGKATGTYEYQVRACNLAGCGGYSAIKGVAVTRAPTAAPALTVPATSGTGSYTVSWTAVTDGATYQLEERPAGGAWTQIHNAAGGSRAISGKASGTYEYQVRACNAAGCGPYAATRSIVVTLPPAGAPALTVPASSTTGSYTVNWTAVSAATTYQLQERVAGGSWSVVYNAGGTSSAISGKGYSTYDYQVRACNAGGCGAYSSVGSITVAPPPPPVPTGLKVTQSGYCRAIWNAASGATKYDLKINAGAIVYSGSSTAYVDDFGCATWYAVRACNAYTCSAWSPPAYKQGGGGTPLATQPTPEAVSATEGGE